MLSSTRTWLFRIAYNVFYDYRRSVKLTSDIDTMPARSSRTADTTVKLDIYTAMQMLSENERTCVTLAMVEGYSMKEITEYLGVSRDTVLDWIERRNMPAAKIGRLWKFKISEVDAWMKSGVAADK